MDSAFESMRILFLTISCMILFASVNGQEILVKVSYDGAAKGPATAFVDHSTLSFEANSAGIISIKPIAAGEHLITLFHEVFESSLVTNPGIVV